MFEVDGVALLLESRMVLTLGGFFCFTDVRGALCDEELAVVELELDLSPN